MNYNVEMRNNSMPQKYNIYYDHNSNCKLKQELFPRRQNTKMNSQKSSSNDRQSRNANDSILQHINWKIRNSISQESAENYCIFNYPYRMTTNNNTHQISVSQVPSPGRQEKGIEDFILQLTDIKEKNLQGLVRNKNPPYYHLFQTRRQKRNLPPVQLNHLKFLQDRENNRGSNVMSPLNSIILPDKNNLNERHQSVDHVKDIKQNNLNRFIMRETEVINQTLSFKTPIHQGTEYLPIRDEIENSGQSSMKKRQDYLTPPKPSLNKVQKDLKMQLEQQKNNLQFIKERQLLETYSLSMDKRDHLFFLKPLSRVNVNDFISNKMSPINKTCIYSHCLDNTNNSSPRKQRNTEITGHLVNPHELYHSKWEYSPQKMDNFRQISSVRSNRLRSLPNNFIKKNTLLDQHPLNILHQK